jgi:cobalt transporter subunit CbtA
MFTKIAVSALIAGFAAGLVASVLQFAFVQPILLHAELFEADPNTTLDIVRMARGAFDPMREAMNVMFSALVYTGYAFMLLAGMVFAEERGQPITPRAGLLWGAAGFIAMHFAPAFGLSPEMPGMVAAALEPRQIWWYLTVACTGAGLWLIAFGRNWMMWGVAVILIAAPHLIGAPLPDTLTQTAPPELAAAFAARTLGVALVVWSTLGLFLGAVWNSKLSEV